MKKGWMLLILALWLCLSGCGKQAETETEAGELVQAEDRGNPERDRGDFPGSE